ncbi:MAG TPA: A24 family peptidase [Gaiellaceae bacterium]|nr:A24 family peptidase [Gaiellaceae bacterium]
MASFADYPPEAPSRIVLALRRREVGNRVRRLAAHRYAAAGGVALPLVGLAYLRFGASGRFAVAAFLIPVLCVLAAIDLAERRLPNRIVLPATAVVLTAQIALSPERALEWTLAALGGALILLLPLIVLRTGVGMGDVKLMLLLGAALGAAVLTGFLVASLAAGAYAAVLLARGGHDARRTAFAFGPFLVFGALVALFLQ